MLDIVVDTNALYEGKRLRSIKDSRDVRLWGSVANVIELVTDVVDDTTLKRTKGRLRTLVELCEADLLPDFDQLVLRELGLEPDLTDARSWREDVVKTVLDTDSFASLTLDIEHARRRRAEHATAFRVAVNQVIGNVLPGADTSDENWRVKAREEDLESIRSELWSLDRLASYLLLFRIAPHISQEDVAKVIPARVAQVARLYGLGYRGWLWRTLRDGRKPRPNDAIDLHFLLPLWRDGWVLLTQEERLREILSAGEFPDDKLRRLSDLDGGL